MKKILLLKVAVICFGISKAQIIVNNNAVATSLANRLIGAGVNVANATLNCPPLASGDFFATNSNLGLDSGIVLTTGTADSTSPFTGINGPANGPSFGHGAPGDPDLTLLCGQQTNDACILEFDFETTGDSVKFNYVFGSSEYPSFTCTNYNDVFGFFVSGPGIAGPFSNGAINIATVPGSSGTCPVGVSTIYCPNNPGCCNTTNTNCFNLTAGCTMFNAANNTCNYFVCNANGTTVNYQGFTTVLRAEAQIQPCQVYHFKLAIADAFDDILDSGIMLEAGSFTSNSVGLNLDTALLSANGNPVLIEGCDSLYIDINIQKYGVNTFDTVRFTIQGSAINNIDYNFLPNYIVFSPNPNDTVRRIAIGALKDNIPEGTETIVIYLQNFCSTSLVDSLTIEIIDSLGADFFISNNGPGTQFDSVCLGTSFIFSPIVFPIQGVGPLTYSWDFGDGTTVTGAGPVNQVHAYSAIGTYVVQLFVSDSTGCTDSARKVVFVDEPAYVQLSASPLSICTGEPVQFYDSIAPHTYNWFYDFDDGVLLDSLRNPKHVFDAPGVYNVSLRGDYLVCPDEVKTVTINVNEYPLINLGEDKTFCPGVDSAVTLRNLENPNEILTWSTGVSAASIAVSQTGRYWAAVDNNGCAGTDSIWVKRDCYLNIPNSFSPNGDGLNDYFIPRQMLSSGIIEFDMKIMNRWGELIFNTTEINGRGWDGEFGGQDQPNGVYVYLITVRWRNGFQNTFNGNVTLLR